MVLQLSWFKDYYYFSIQQTNKRRKLNYSFTQVKRAALAFSLFTLCHSSPLYAVSYSGRATVGSYISNEHFKLESDGTFNNDFSTISSRLFTRFTEITENRLEGTVDIRDKHDFFEKYDSEKLALTGNNTLQAREVSLKYNDPRSRWLATVGRFSISDAGAVNVDGAEAGVRWTESWRSSVFGGQDPKLPNQTYFQQNPHAYAFGTYTVFQPTSSSWRSNTLNSTALVAKNVQSHLDRFYFYDFFLYEWESPSRIMGMLYLDLVPRTYVQTGLLAYSQKLNKDWSSTLQGTAIDTIEYSRRKGVLETLAPSPYREGTLSVRQILNNTTSFNYYTLFGVRKADHRKVQIYSFGPDYTQIFHKEVSGGLKLGFKKNFTSRDFFTKINIGYYPKNWELVLDEYLAIQKEAAQTYYPIISEVSLAHFFSREFYGTLSYQNATSAIAKVNTFFIYLGYRFGSKDVPPLRDGAPPRGRL